MKYIPVIGLEVHVQLLTTSKLFCADATAYGQAPNTNISVISLAHPGTLPKLNIKALEYAIKMGLACHSEISRHNIFDRKNYFYPDLPKGYQITQDRTPICIGGYVSIETKQGLQKDIRLNRIHLEEDAGKSIHESGEAKTKIDFNRAGVPLIEMVTEPVIHSSEEAYAFLTEIRKLVRYLDICDGNMEEGSMRCDANISVKLADASSLGRKVEIKNMNSIRNVQRAIDYEIERQIAELEKGNQIMQETRAFDAHVGKTFSMRIKEELNDYRYFPDPDLAPAHVTDQWLNEIKNSMPTLPWELCDKFITQYKLPRYDALILTETKELAAYFEALCSHTANFKAASNWLMGPLKYYLNEYNISVNEFPLKPIRLAELISLVDEGKLSFSAASQHLFTELIKSPAKSALLLAQELNLIQVSNEDVILPIVDEVLKDYPEKVEAYRKGKKGLLSMFMGEVVKRSKGKADPKVTNQILLTKLK